jgi:hypothetical protein
MGSQNCAATKLGANGKAWRQSVECLRSKHRNRLRLSSGAATRVSRRNVTLFTHRAVWQCQGPQSHSILLLSFPRAAPRLHALQEERSVFETVRIGAPWSVFLRWMQGAENNMGYQGLASGRDRPAGQCLF